MQIWEDLLGISPIGLRESFFEIGGHSLLAVRLMARVRRELGRDLPLVTLFRSPTIQDLAGVVREQERPTQRSALVEIQPRGARPPVFFVHAIGGTVFSYWELARLLGSDQPFYGLQTPELDGGQKLPDRLEDMAAHYVEAVRTIRPEGPYILGGWSMGGVIAYEMARQLERQGGNVGRLLLLDSFVPENDDALQDADERNLLLQFIGDLGGSFHQELDLKDLGREDSDEKEQLRYIAEQAAAAGLLPAATGLNELTHLFSLYKRNHRALRHYRAQTYAGKLVLVKAEERYQTASDPTLGWGDLGAAVEIHTISGNHYSMLQPPHVESLARLLREILD